MDHFKNKELLNKYPFSTGFEFTFGSIEIFDDMTTPKAKSVAFTMKTQFACIYGNDLIPTIPKMKPSREMAYLQVMKFNKSLSTGIKKLVERTDPDDIGKAAVWLSKRILRAGFFLVMDLEKKLTKDLYPSYESFAKHYPNKSDEMYTVLYLALNPKSEKSVLLDFYKPFGEWLSNEINNKFNYLA